MKGSMLTSKQRDIYEFIKDYMRENNRSPYIREIQSNCQFSSYKAVVDKLLALEKKGYIKRRLNKHRSIKLNHEN